MTGVDAVVVAAGRSRRMGGGGNKVLLPLAARPVLWYSLHALERCEEIDRVWLVVRPEDRMEIQMVLATYSFEKPRERLVDGGEERFDSVRNGLEACFSDPPEFVLIHDAARPFLDLDILPRIVSRVREDRAVVLGTPAVDTLKLSRDGCTIAGTVDRDRVWQVQTPQAFEYSLILDAYRSWPRVDGVPTDDTAVVAAGGHPVSLLEGSRFNMKVTGRTDLVFAEALIKGRVFPWIESD